MELPFAYLTEQTTFERAAAENVFEGKPFGHANDDWLRLLAKRREGDELWHFAPPYPDSIRLWGGGIGPRRPGRLDGDHGRGLIESVRSCSSLPTNSIARSGPPTGNPRLAPGSPPGPRMSFSIPSRFPHESPRPAQPAAAVSGNIKSHLGGVHG